MKFLKNKLELIDGEPYESDLLENRRAYGDSLTKFIGKIEDGCVITIDAKWGEGKTTFTKWWVKDLSKDHLPVYFDAFANDFNAEPFWAITKVLFSQIENNDDFTKEMSKTLEKITEVLIPALLSFSAITAATMAFGPAGTVGATVAKDGIKSLGVFVKDLVKEFYKKDVSELASLIDRDLDHWLA